MIDILITLLLFHRSAGVIWPAIASYDYSQTMKAMFDAIWRVSAYRENKMRRCFAGCGFVIKLTQLIFLVKSMDGNNQTARLLCLKAGR